MDEINQHVEFGEQLGSDQGFRKHAESEVVRSFHEDLSGLIRGVLGTVHQPTYAFAMEYDQNAYLPPHLELVTNEISSTLCFFRSGTADFDLSFDKRWRENKFDDRYTASAEELIPAKQVVKIHLGLGDIGIFNGRNHFHWREREQDTKFVWRGVLFHFMHKYTAQAKREQVLWGKPEEKNGIGNSRYGMDAWRLPAVI